MHMIELHRLEMFNKPTIFLAAKHQRECHLSVAAAVPVLLVVLKL